MTRILIIVALALAACAPDVATDDPTLTVDWIGEYADTLCEWRAACGAVEDRQRCEHAVVVLRCTFSTRGCGISQIPWFEQCIWALDLAIPDAPRPGVCASVPAACRY